MSVISIILSLYILDNPSQQSVTRAMRILFEMQLSGQVNGNVVNPNNWLNPF